MATMPGKNKIQPSENHSKTTKSRETGWQSSFAPRKGKGRFKNGHRRTGSFDASEQTESCHWIRNHIEMRECITFIADEKRKKRKSSINSKGEERKCKCGYLKSQHHQIALANKKPPDTKWNSLMHTSIGKTNAFGELEFVGFGQRVGKFVRVNHTTEPEDVLKLMREQWNLELPNLLISVTGGAKNFYIKPRLQEVFRKGLIKAAQSTGAWIITGGTHAGVMKHVGEAVRTNAVAGRSSNKVVAIGVATWGIVHHNDELINDQGSFPARYHLEDPPPGRAALDPNHSHFILVDDGTNEQFGKEIKLRAELEKRISEHKTRASTQAPGSSSVSIPVVLLALQGGPGTLETVYQGVSNNTPAVIVEGSGGAADILAYGFNHSLEEVVAVEGHVGKQEIIGRVDTQLEEVLRAKIAEEFGGNDPSKLDPKKLKQWTRWVVESIRKKQLLSIFEIDSRESAKNIDVAMLRALLRANKDDYQHQLKLALAWNRSDIAETDIFTADRRWKQEELEDLMYSAILEDKVNFVKLFLENGVSLKDFLTVRRLQRLYSEIPQSGVLFDMLQKRLRERISSPSKSLKRKPSTPKVSVTMNDVGHVIQSLMGEIYVPLYERNPERYGGGDPKAVCEDPTRELFVFCVLLNRQEMARLFWEEGKEGVAAALVGSKLLKSMARELENDTELSEEMLEHADKFEDLALGVLNECWGEDELRTQLLLVRELYLWGELTCLRIAISGNHLNFIAHSACQALLNNIWMGKLALDTSIIRLFTCIFIPPLVPALIYFREDQKEEETLIEPLGTDERHYSISTGMGRPVVARTRTNAGMIIDSIPEGEELDKSMEMVVVHSSGSGLINNRQTSQVQFKDEEKEEEYEAPHTEEGELDFRSSGKRIGPLTRFYLFYDAPITTFMHNVISYILFLCLYSVVILTEFVENVLSPIDYVLAIWIFTLICEEIRQLITTEARSVSGKLLEYIGNYWNLFDLANIVTFIVAFVLRFFSETFIVARVLYSLNLMIFSFRLLHIFYINKEMGPKLIMIARMLKDLMFFIFILIIFILAYGVATQAILYPRESRVGTVLQGIFHKAYFQIYGELFLEEIMNDGFNCVANDNLAMDTNQQRCPSQEGTYVVPVLLGLYMLVTNVLLLNLLIAMFGYTFEKVQENTDKIWKFQRYDLIKEYSDRPPLAPPVIIFSHLFLLFRAITMGCCKRCRPGDNVMKVKLESAERKQLILWEYLNTENYLQQTRRDKSQETGERVHDTQEKVDELKDLANEQDERLTRLEEQMLKSTMSLESIVQSQAWIIKSLQQNNLSAKEAAPELELSPAEKVPRSTLPSLTREPTRSSLHQGKRPKTVKGRRRTLDGQPIQEIHQKARTCPYPMCEVNRCQVPDDKVPWEVPFSSYHPVNYTADCVLAGPPWADVDLMSMSLEERPFLMYNQLDTKFKGAVDRTSFIGTYKVENKLPLNPKGRTGMVGRGLLGRFGPNHAADPVVTRWKKDMFGNKEVHRETHRNVLEFVAIQRKDNGLWAIPGGMVEPGENLTMTLKNEFGEEALGKLDKTDQEKRDMSKKLDKLFQQGKEVFKGYSDDPRNTDNAWIETTAINYHDEEGYLMQNFTLQAGDDAGAVQWQDVDGSSPLFASHQAILKHVAGFHNAHF